MARCLRLFCKWRDKAKPHLSKDQAKKDIRKSATLNRALNDMERAGCTDLLCAPREAQWRNGVMRRGGRDVTIEERLTQGTMRKARSAWRGVRAHGAGLSVRSSEGMSLAAKRMARDVTERGYADG
jgi:hypothetical protein